MTNSWSNGQEHGQNIENKWWQTGCAEIQMDHSIGRGRDDIYVPCGILLKRTH